MGPHHPSMHGVLRLIVTLDATMFTEAITVNGPEQLGNIQVPKRASYIRVIMLEFKPYSFSPTMARTFYGRYWASVVVDVKEVINWGLSGPMLGLPEYHGIYV
ncbi:hypothetical protein V8G54_037891 (chloroplast) [Vigna mungo]|uniref:NAD(P)H dehydrogenase subunit H n=1 Tax=Vigna mungo TaxID=3915 RepID=A0AAQ3MF18_VIGMU